MAVRTSVESCAVFGSRAVAALASHKTWNLELLIYAVHYVFKVHLHGDPKVGALVHMLTGSAASACSSFETAETAAETAHSTAEDIADTVGIAIDSVLNPRSNSAQTLHRS